MDQTPFHQAIKALGGQVRAAPRLKRTQPTISQALKTGKPSAEMCMAIERETAGKFTCEQLRPDLAHLFKTLRQGAKKQRRAA